MEFVKDGKVETINVPLEDYIPVIPFLETGPPAILRDVEHAKGLKNREYKIVPHTINHLRNPEKEANLLMKYAADEVRVPYELYVEDFMRMIAKIGYCFSVFRYGLSSFEEVFVRPAILGETNDVWDWVGSDGYHFIYQTYDKDHSHVIATGREKSTQVHARVKLWNRSLTPEYIVVVGKLKEKVAALLDAVGAK
jgi:hypothetical protein